MKKNILIYLALLLSSIQGSQAQAKLQIQAGAEIVIKGKAFIQLQDTDWINEGGFISPDQSTVSMTTTQANQRPQIGGAASSNFYHLVLAAAQSAVQLENDIEVLGDLSFQAGNLFIGNTTVDLGQSGQLVNERAESRIVSDDHGIVRRVIDLKQPKHVNPGNLGLSIQSKQNLGRTHVIRGHEVFELASGKSVRRYFDVIPENNVALNATVRYHYFDPELDGQNESHLRIWEQNGTEAAWKLLGAQDHDVQNNWVEQSGVQCFHRQTLVTEGTAKPTPTDQSLPKREAIRSQVNSLNVFPNPSSGNIQVNYELQSLGNVTLTITNAKGGLVKRVPVMHRPAGHSTEHLDLSQLSPGLYILRLDTEMGSESRKISIVR
ncbi:MAG: T9SS type A sorting domain-containing protein [Saprospiraceae bacterium]|nr:T9SS type A sorting domain-containing protein [Saprospiraceae bacterium]